MSKILVLHFWRLPNTACCRFSFLKIVFNLAKCKTGKIMKCMFSMLCKISSVGTSMRYGKFAYFHQGIHISCSNGFFKDQIPSGCSVFVVISSKPYIVISRNLRRAQFWQFLKSQCLKFIVCYVLFKKNQKTRFL